MRRLIIYIAFILCIFLSFSISYAKSFDISLSESHGRDYCECLGIDCKNNSIYLDTLKDFSAQIDKPGEFYKLLQNKYHFSWDQYTHRLLFHWGFNENPKNLSILRLQVEKEVPKSKRKEFYRCLIEEQARRNKEMIKTIKNGFRVQSKKKASALTTILYDIHILGDYSCKSCKVLEPLCDINKILKDITKHGIRRLVPDRNSNNRILNRLYSLQKLPNEKEYAAKILEILRAEMPNLLSEQFRTLGTTGLIVTSSYIMFWKFTYFLGKGMTLYTSIMVRLDFLFLY
jgi:hypothetical protein